MTVCKSEDYTKAFKQELSNQILGEGMFERACKPSLPDKNIKATKWGEIVGFEESDYSLQELESMMYGFFQWGQQDVL